MPMLSVSWSRKVRWISAEAVEGRELDDRLDLAFEQDRQDDDVHRRGLAEAGADLHVVVGHVR